MSDKAVYWGSVVLSAAALVLLVTNVALISANRQTQLEVSQRQGMIGNAVGLSQINQALVQALADVTIKSNDKDVRELLSSQGISVKPKSEAVKDATKK